MGYRRRVAVTSAPVVIAVALACAGCGLGPDHTLNTRSLDSQIAAQLKARYPFGRVQVSCPSGVREKVGTGFSCSAVVDAQNLTLDGSVTSPGGRYSIQPAQAIVVSSQAASTLQQQISAQLHEPASVTCSPPAVRVVPAEGQFACNATLGGSVSRQVTVTVLDAAGHTRFSLNP
ncbi:MAG TPA: DUF4333 domain-containing protein [Acidimicrobiales bacterium]